MKKEFYVQSILKDTLLPFVAETFPDGHRFQQDNDPKHKSRLFLICSGPVFFLVFRCQIYYST